jgi:hypothetical protein
MQGKLPAAGGALYLALREEHALAWLDGNDGDAMACSEVL